MKRLVTSIAAGLLFASIAGASIANAQSDGQSVSISGFAFAQPELSVPAGTTVTWTNTDGVQHTTSAVDGTWDSGALSTSGTFSFTFNQAGDFAYQCDIHPNMQGIIHVLPA